MFSVAKNLFFKDTIIHQFNNTVVKNIDGTKYKETDDIRDIQTIDIYDFDEDTVDDKLNKIIKATSLLNLIARAFPSFEHLIKADQKKDIVNLLYSAPNKIFYFWASEIEEDFTGFIQYFLQKNDDEYQLDQAVSASISTLQNMSISLLLDLYYV